MDLSTINEELLDAISTHKADYSTLSDDEFIKLSNDIMECYEKYHFEHYHEYFKFDFENKNDAQRATFSGHRILTDYYDLNSREYKQIIRNKYKAYNRLGKYYKREILKIEGFNDFSLFMQFVAKHKGYIVKEVEGSTANNIFVIHIDESTNIKQEFLRLCQYEDIIIEELIEQTDEMAQFNPSSVNTVRIATHSENGKMSVVFAILRTGRAGTPVDNTSMGGIACAIDCKTGEVISDGYNTSMEKFSVHPDSNVAFKGFKIPHWDELVSTVEEIDKELGGLDYAGWDMALTDDGWVMVEANGRPDNATIQMIMDDVRGSGLRQEFDFIYKALGIE